MVTNNLNDKIQNALDVGLKYAKKAGADHCEAFGINERSFNLELEKDKPKHNMGIQHGLSFRVITNKAVGFAYTSSFEEKDIEMTVKMAIQCAKTKKKDPDLQPFPEFKENTSKLAMDKELYSVDTNSISELFEKMLPDELPKNTYFLQAMGMVGMGDSFLKTTQGIDLVESDAGYGLGIGFLSTHGFPNYDFHFAGSRSLGGVDPKEVTKIALEKTLSSAKPQTMSLSGDYPVIITPEGSYGLFGGLFTVLTNLLKGDKASRGETVYADKIGEQIAPDTFTLIDDPLHPDMITSTLYDGEGVPTEKTKLIENGILKTYYLDSYYAGKLNMESNGKAQRGGFFGGNPAKVPPAIGDYATIIEPGNSSLDEMLSETKEGFMLKSFMGIHMSDFSSGRFAVTGSGWYVKDGEVKYPVQDISISGTIPELLLNIDMISKERSRGLNNEVPYVRVAELSVAAKKLDFKVRFGLKVLKTLVKLGIAKNPFI
ncbi:MAG: TldD/PmbA family protein [Candidatus Heimdallarchaeota archaeon]|nr:TldD/PmbA family protein [Candidatus Heimdallarchaeota archaeon]